MPVLGKGIATIRRNGFIISFLKLMERVQTKYFFKLIDRKKWYRASYIGERLIALYPERIWFYRKLIECYYNLKEDERANQILEKYINLRFNSFSGAIEEIEKKIGSECPIRSEYTSLGGYQNNGFIEHSVENKKYLTKISSCRRWRERFFHLEIYKRYPCLQDITPKMVRFESNGSNYFITFEKIEGRKPEFIDEVIKEVITMNRIISSIKYEEIRNLFIFPIFDKNFDQYKVINRDSGVFVNLKYFNEIHKELPNRLIFSPLISKLEELNYSFESIDLIRRLEKMIFENKMYEGIIPEKHYSLRHGDLNPTNMIIDNYSGKLLLLDWGFTRIGPRWCDIAGFLGMTRRPFHKIITLFLANKSANRLVPIEKFFFIYTLVIVWFNELSKEEFDNLHHLYLQPAIEYMETIEKEILNFESV